jgi:drug/metabolite transporter (DMT)-like permease
MMVLTQNNTLTYISYCTVRVSLTTYPRSGTTCHIFGMSLTTANHGAFLLQLTTLIVPILQGLRGEKIPRQIQLAVVLALAGIVAFTQDPAGAGANNVNIDEASVKMGDALVLGAAFFYSLYDIQTFYWGKEIPRTELVTIKIGFQAFLSCLLCGAVATPEVLSYLQNGPEWSVLVPTVLWSGLIVNALATFLQVGGMQSVGPTRAQTIFASQPLWASGLNFVFLGEVVGLQGLAGGGAFLGALVLAATAKAPDPTATEAGSTESS